MKVLTLIRDTFTDHETMGKLFYNEEWICETIEDCDRGLTSDMTLMEIKEQKVDGKTCIPYGLYEFEWYDSPRHGRVPLLKDVRGFTYIEIHIANWARELLGCIAPGLVRFHNMVQSSGRAFRKLKKLIEQEGITHINIIKQ